MDRDIRNTVKRKKLAKEASAILRRRSKDICDKAKEIILAKDLECDKLHKALLYSTLEWRNIKHPGLLHLACEAVGGNPNAVNDVGAALLLLLTAAHVHDDIIDQSVSVDGKPTVLAKYSGHIAILVGDVFIFEGWLHLAKACEKLPTLKRTAVMNLINSAFLEICHAELEEIDFRSRHASPKKCLEILKMRAAVGEAVMQIGAIIGNGSKEEIKCLGHYGRTFGLLAAIKDEFADIFESDELRNRYLHRCLPLPIIYALQGKENRDRILSVLNKEKVTKRDTDMLANLVLNTKKVKNLKKHMLSHMQSGLRSLRTIKRSTGILRLLLQSTVEDL